ncbi:MAG TPA: hypothetical protein VKR32_09625 [Puia sp.]|nr:hypothetical protein [Puia sp.]
MEWLAPGVSQLNDLITFLRRKAQTNDIVKKHLIMELRDNLNLFKNAYINHSSYDRLAGLLSNEAYKEAIRNNFSYKKFKRDLIGVDDVADGRNKKYIGWTLERLAFKIDEKIVELKNIRELNGGSFVHAKNDIPLMFSNLYFRMKLMADLIRLGN